MYLDSLETWKLIGEDIKSLCTASSNDNFLASIMESTDESLAYTRGAANDQDAIHSRHHIYSSTG